MTSTVRRAGAVAGLCTLSLVVPFLGPTPAAIGAAAVLLVAFVVTDGPVFDLLALPDDRDDDRLNSLAIFVVAATLLGAVMAITSMSLAVFVGTLLLVGYGELTEQLTRLRLGNGAVAAAAFCVGGTLAAIGGQIASQVAVGTPVTAAFPVVAFLAVSGALTAAIIRDQLSVYDDPLVLVVVGLLLWLLSELRPVVDTSEFALALAVTAVLGYVSYALDTASVAGMFSGILLGLLTIVLGGWEWFVVLVSFFVIGGLSTKFRYEEKAARGVAEANDGARGSANVFSNSAVALAALLGYAASDTAMIAVDPALFRYAFAGAVATAMSDTLSSEIGGVYDRPRLITTFESVPPGTDGGVTWQGELAGVAGALVVGIIAFVLFPTVGLSGTTLIVLAGVAGMTVDSLLGATVEGPVMGNQGVNFFATLAGAIVAAVVALPMGLVG